MKPNESHNHQSNFDKVLKTQIYTTDIVRFNCQKWNVLSTRNVVSLIPRHKLHEASEIQKKKEKQKRSRGRDWRKDNMRC